MRTTIFCEGNKNVVATYHVTVFLSENLIAWCGRGKIKNLKVIEPENETSWNRRFSDFNENRHKDGNLGLHDYEGQQKFILFNSGKISISG